ncbi:BQ5605_C040g11886 [Microbotryum silenes-dioicae]|uniref:BQ5605_C040g11886 protein n=1 Tax=Microbotryum silenes-dioicae TaxID=796604 RepID=A0A2X0MTK8_9BASI|nr:BQ5605_C040g11886 [Microbotryum silenes-dioicae]
MGEIDIECVLKKERVNETRALDSIRVQATSESNQYAATPPSASIRRRATRAPTSQCHKSLWTADPLLISHNTNELPRAGELRQLFCFFGPVGGWYRSGAPMPSPPHPTPAQCTSNGHK